MTRINLLPWRERERKEREQRFVRMLAFAVILMGVLLVFIHLQMERQMDEQSARNTFLESEIKTLDTQIKEIQSLEAEKSKLLARMKVIEELQAQRPQVVHMFDEISRLLPEGVYLTQIKQDGKMLVINGMAQSNARVSAFMRALDSSDWFADPSLEVIEGRNQGAERASAFALRVQQVQPGEQPVQAAAEKAP